MKKMLLLMIAPLFLFFSANATHNTGGEISVKQVDPFQYEATIHTYTKASSVAADRDSLQICWGDGLCDWIIRDTSYLVAGDLKYNTYSNIHTYPDEGTFTISLTDPNRNGGILNVNAPSSDNVTFHIETTILVNGLINSTPILENPIADTAYIGEVYQHNAAAIDCDGDSLSYELIVPLSGIGTIVPNYYYPDEIGAGPDNNIGIHSEFGTITWSTPQMEGTYTIAMKISEYRAGALLSTTIRDFQVTVKSDFCIAPEIEVNLSQTVTLSVGDTLAFDIASTDPENGNVLLQGFGQPFLLNNPATFDAPIDFNVSPLTSSFNWVITDDHVLLSPHYLVFRVEKINPNGDAGLTKYKVIKIAINDSPTFTNTITRNLDFKIFPNPIVDGNLNIKFNDKVIGEKVRIEIFSLDGKLLLEKRMRITEIQQSIDLQAITSGNYIFNLSTENQTKSTFITIK